MRRRVIQPGERVRVRLTPPQRDLVIEHAFIDPELAKRLRVAEADGASIVALLDLDDLDELLGAVAAEANHTKDEKLRKRLDVIWERLRDVAESHTDDPSPAHPATFLSLVKELVSVPKYTPKQGQYLAFIYYYTKIHGQSPAEADLQRYFEVSPPAVHRMVIALEERGFLERTPGRARSIRLLIDRADIPDLE